MPQTKKRLLITYSAWYWERISWEFNTKQEALNARYRCWDYEHQYAKRNPNYDKVLSPTNPKDDTN